MHKHGVKHVAMQRAQTLSHAVRDGGGGEIMARDTVRKGLANFGADEQFRALIRRHVDQHFSKSLLAHAIGWSGVDQAHAIVDELAHQCQGVVLAWNFKRAWIFGALIAANFKRAPANHGHRFVKSRRGARGNVQRVWSIGWGVGIVISSQFALKITVRVARLMVRRIIHGSM